MNLFLEAVFLFPEVGQVSSTGLRQVFQTVDSSLQHHLTFGQFRIHHMFFRVSMIRVQQEGI